MFNYKILLFTASQAGKFRKPAFVGFFMRSEDCSRLLKGEVVECEL